MIQGTQEWLELRKRHLGASDAPVIMNVSPWKKKYRLWEEKLGLQDDQSSNVWMRRGIELEPLARQVYSSKVGVDVSPEVLFHKECKWMMASMDGVSSDRSLAVEIKCPGEKDHNTAKDGLIPKKYYPQLQHQLAVLGIDMLHYFSFIDENDNVLIEVKRDDEYIDLLQREEAKFWDCVRSFSPPEEDIKNRVDEEWILAAREWQEVSNELNIIKKREAQCKDRLIQLSNGKSSLGGGISLKKAVRKGAIDYSRALDGLDLNLEEFRKPPIEYWRINKG